MIHVPYKVCNGLLWSVRLPVNSRLQAVKFWGSQNLSMDFNCEGAVQGSTEHGHSSKKVCQSFGIFREPTLESTDFLYCFFFYFVNFCFHLSCSFLLLRCVYFALLVSVLCPQFLSSRILSNCHCDLLFDQLVIYEDFVQFPPICELSSFSSDTDF